MTAIQWYDILLISNSKYQYDNWYWSNHLESFELCSPFDGTKPGDQAFFLGSIVAILQGAVQYDWNGSYNISDVCAIMTNEEIGAPLERLSALNSL